MTCATHSGLHRAPLRPFYRKPRAAKRASRGVVLVAGSLSTSPLNMTSLAHQMNSETTMADGRGRGGYRLDATQIAVAVQVTLREFIAFHAVEEIVTSTAEEPVSAQVWRITQSKYECPTEDGVGLSDVVRHQSRR